MLQPKTQCLDNITTPFSTNSWRISPSTSWCPFFSVICPETAAAPSCCGRCCWRSSPSSWILPWTPWPSRSVLLQSEWRTHMSLVRVMKSVRTKSSRPQPNATVGPSVSEILDVIGEIRVSLLTDEQLMNSSLIHTWFSERLRLFLPSASGRFLSCLSRRNLSCHSYQQMWVTVCYTSLCLQFQLRRFRFLCPEYISPATVFLSINIFNFHIECKLKADRGLYLCCLCHHNLLFCPVQYEKQNFVLKQRMGHFNVFYYESNDKCEAGNQSVMICQSSALSV